MKKILTVCLALMLMMALTVPTFAAVSPDGDVIVPDGGNDSPEAPQTGSEAIVLVAGVAVAALATSSVAAVKLAKKN